MFYSRLPKKSCFSLLLGICIHTQIYATPITWISQSSNDLNLSSNWNPAIVPTSGDDAVFDSTIPGIVTNPVGQGVDFTCSNFQFPFDAFPFNIAIQNRQLTFTGFGILGTNTDATANVSNTDTPYTLTNQIFFNGPLSTCNSATLQINNSSTVSGAIPATFTSIIDRQIYSPNEFIISSLGEISANNFGQDFSTGAGGNTTASVRQGQAIFGDTCSLGDNVRMTVISNGLSLSPATNNLTGHVGEWQLHSVNDFVAGDGFSLFVANAGISQGGGGAGGQNTAVIDSVSGTTGLQIEMNGEFRVGDFANILVLNSGFVTGSTTTDPIRSGIMNNEQVRIRDAFESGDFCSFTVLNEGRDSSSSAGGNIIGAVPSIQLRFDSRAETKDESTFTLVNFGSNKGTSNGLLNTLGATSGQLLVDGAFKAGKLFRLSVTNQGEDSAISSGSNFVGRVGTIQTKFNDEVTLGDENFFLVLSQGTNTGSTTGIGNRVGTVDNLQFDVEGEFHAGNLFELDVLNLGYDSSTGFGGNNTGAIINSLTDASQVLFNNNVSLGNEAIMTVTNSGESIGTTSSQGNLVGFMTKDQFHVSGTFMAGNEFSLDVLNVGESSCVSAGVDQVGVLSGGIQVCFNQECTLGDNGRIAISNLGTYTGSSSTNTYTGYVFDNQACFEGLLKAGENFNLGISNEGIANTVGNGNYVGVSTTQLDIDLGCEFGDNATILVTNKGTNSNATGINNQVGYVIGNQAFVNAITAGQNLQFSVTNSANNTGNINNSVGYITGSQIVFGNDVNINDNSLIFVSNTGTVADSQIVFQNGFNILSGKATFHALNSGTVGFKGIYVQDGLGGNVNIVLSNSSFYVDTALPSFTIGELNGDSTSTAQSRPELIINTDSLTNGNFAGAIQDFPATSSMLTKTGTGTQKLSGVNTYTGLTQVNDGTLILNGSVPGNVVVNLLGKLKGNGIIGGNLTNYGTVAPGESIGILTVLGDYSNQLGTYEVEVNGLGQSDLIDVSGNAILNGGIVAVSTVDGRFSFQTPYTIVAADGFVLGTYTGATAMAFVNPILTYDLQHVYLTIESALLKAAETCNQFGVAKNLDSIVNPNNEQSFVINTIANLPLADAQSDLESFSGFQYTQDVWMTEISTRRFIRRLYDPLRQIVSACGNCDPCSEGIAWLETGGCFTNLHGKKAHKMRVNTYELTAGIQKTFCNDFTFGLAGSYEHDHAKYRSGKGDRHSEFVAAYGLFRPCSFYGLVDLVYGHTCNHLRRTMHAGEFHFKAHSRPNLNTFAFYGEFGLDIKTECYLIQPFAGVQAGKTCRDHIRESRGDAWGLSIKRREWTPVTSRLGFHLSQCNFYGCVDATLDLAWNHLWCGHTNRTKGRFAQFGDFFPICGDHLGRNSLDYAITVHSCYCDCLRAYLELGGEVWSKAHVIDLIGGIELSW